VIVLALDTTTAAGSVAVVEDGVVVREQSGEPGLTHGQRLPADLFPVAASIRGGVSRIDLLAVAAGPGSFTGLRVGIATVQGLATALGRKVVPVCSLEALARMAAAPGTVSAAWIDAHRGQVFAALYDDTGVMLAAPTALSPEDTLREWQDVLPRLPVRFLGDGAVRYAETITNRLGPRCEVVRPVPPLAGMIGRIASERADRAVAPHAVVPIYVRRPDAELARDRRSKSSSG
jgi:tRNA threonylcarbamoyladenosine biosynthesis protein TsaB